MQVHKLAILLLSIYIIAGCQTPPETNNTHKINGPPKTDLNFKFDTHTVRSGETLFSISREFKVSIAEIMLDNHLQKDQVLLVGRILKIRVPVVLKNKQILPAIENKKEITIDGSRNDQKLSLSIRSKAKHFSGNIPYMLIPKGYGYEVSIKGKIHKNYQDYHFGRPLQGVELKSISNQSVKAIHNGAVAFISENFAGYGRSIAIASNQNELVFIYGLESITVKIGDIVRKGDRIGTINSGKILGLKIIRKGVFQDPGKIIPGMK